MKLEFDNLYECFEFIRTINNMNSQKDEPTTVEMSNNQRWLYNNELAIELDAIHKEIASIREELQSEQEEPTNRQNLIIRYSNTYKSKLPKIRAFNKDGTFRVGRGNGRKAKWDIKTLLKLKHCLKTDLSIRKISKKVGLTEDTVGRLLYCIEIGKFDKYFEEWEQIQAKKFYDKNKSFTNLSIENNPQKRREKGMG